MDAENQKKSKKLSVLEATDLTAEKENSGVI
jgi:hypothetical protein